MNTPAKLGAFAIGLAAVFGTAFGAGHVAGPVRTGSGTTAATSGGTKEKPAAAGPPAGLQVSEKGYTLTTVPGAEDAFAFRILGPDGRAVTTYDVEHDKRMHLIVVRRDLSGFRHVHPVMDGDGTWRIDAPMDGPGTYRAFADFKPTGADGLTLGIDVGVAGTTKPRPLPVPERTASVDGYTVTLDGTLEAGKSSRLSLSISRDGRPVTDLQPYLAAYGHLVALRAGDLAYLHVHPDGTPGDGRTKAGPAIAFFAEVPSTGAYRLYLDFQHGGKVHTAEFTVTVGGVNVVEEPDHADETDDHGH